jgi:Tfp pilus assembly protein PilF
MLRKDDPDILLAQHELALAYIKDRQIKKAIDLLEVVVKAKETIATDHPSRLASQHALAIAYEASRQIKKAVELLDYFVAVQARTV